MAYGLEVYDATGEPEVIISSAGGLSSLINDTTQVILAATASTNVTPNVTMHDDLELVIWPSQPSGFGWHPGWITVDKLPTYFTITNTHPNYSCTLRYMIIERKLPSSYSSSTYGLRVYDAAGDPVWCSSRNKFSYTAGNASNVSTLATASLPGASKQFDPLNTQIMVAKPDYSGYSFGSITRVSDWYTTQTGNSNIKCWNGIVPMWGASVGTVAGFNYGYLTKTQGKTENASGYGLQIKNSSNVTTLSTGFTNWACPIGVAKGRSYLASTGEEIDCSFLTSAQFKNHVYVAVGPVAWDWNTWPATVDDSTPGLPKSQDRTFVWFDGTNRKIRVYGQNVWQDGEGFWNDGGLLYDTSVVAWWVGGELP